MSTLDDIAQERQRLAERLAKLDAERARLAEQLAELDAAERVLSRFAQAGGRVRRGRRSLPREASATAAPAAPRQGRRRRGAPKPAELSLGEATLRAVAAQPGASAVEVGRYLAERFAMQVRPNHLGMALQRHRRAGRLDQRDLLWYPHETVAREAAG